MAAKLLAVCERVMDSTTVADKVREHEIPVTYDGADLADVAVSCGLSTEEVIARHSGRPYSVDLLGFVPGFGYLSELDASLQLPRRPQPRPSGSGRKRRNRRCADGGVSARYSWRLAHHRAHRLRDVRSVARPASAPPRRRHSPIRARAVITITRAPPYLTVQDTGRKHSRSSGVPRGGAMDVFALQALNAIVGNALDSAALEWALGGGTLRFQGDCVFAIGGAYARATLAGRTMPSFTTCRARAGDQLTVEQLTAGRFLYIAFSGGIDVP